jgi:hypothetical protein
MPFRENLFVSLYNTVPASPPLCPPYLSLSLSLSPCFSPAVILPFRASPFPAPRNKPDETSASSRNLIKPTVASVLHEVSSQSLLPLFFSFPSPSPLPPSPSPAGSRAGRVVAVAARARVFLGRVFGRVCRGFPSTGRFPSANINGRMKQGLLRKASALSCLLLPPLPPPRPTTTVVVRWCTRPAVHWRALRCVVLVVAVITDVFLGSVKLAAVRLPRSHQRLRQATDPRSARRC